MIDDQKAWTFALLAFFVLAVVFVIPEAIDRELHRQKVACEIDKARGYPVRCEP